jgi:hypothetical protein
MRFSGQEALGTTTPVSGIAVLVQPVVQPKTDNQRLIRTPALQVQDTIPEHRISREALIGLSSEKPLPRLSLLFPATWQS